MKVLLSDENYSILNILQYWYYLGKLKKVSGILQIMENTNHYTFTIIPGKTQTLISGVHMCDHIYLLGKLTHQFCQT